MPSFIKFYGISMYYHVLNPMISWNQQLHITIQVQFDLQTMPRWWQPRRRRHVWIGAAAKTAAPQDPKAWHRQKYSQSLISKNKSIHGKTMKNICDIMWPHWCWHCVLNVLMFAFAGSISIVAVVLRSTFCGANMFLTWECLSSKVSSFLIDPLDTSKFWQQLTYY